jgi:hypothetical protein
MVQTYRQSGSRDDDGPASRDLARKMMSKKLTKKQKKLTINQPSTISN